MRATRHQLAELQTAAVAAARPILEWPRRSCDKQVASRWQAGGKQVASRWQGGGKETKEVASGPYNEKLKKLREAG